MRSPTSPPSPPGLTDLTGQLPPAASPPPLVTLLTDFGTRDYYVAAVKGTLLRLAPGCQIVDISHDVAAGDVAAGAFLLGAAARWFPPATVHLAVVDPGVGSERRILVAATSEGRFVAPDNGLLTSILEQARTFAVGTAELFLPGPGDTFHGRDRFAPVAAHLLRGGAPESLGAEISDALRLPLPRPQRRPGTLEGTIVHIDRYGNLVSDIPSSWLGGGPMRARIGEHEVRRRVSHYGQLAPEEPGMLPGSLGTLEFSLRDRSLADNWRVCRGSHVKIEADA